MNLRFPALHVGARVDPPDSRFALQPHIEAVERQLIIRALREAAGDRRRTAALLGIRLRTLQGKLRHYGLTKVYRARAA